MLKKNITEFFDKIARKLRGKLSHHPILYAFVGGIGVVLFWRGIWHAADDIKLGSIISLVAGAVILIITGVFVSEFIGKKLIITGLIGEKKMITKEEGQIEQAETEIKKEEVEIETEETQLKNLQSTLNRLEKKLEHIDEDLEKK